MYGARAVKSFGNYISTSISNSNGPTQSQKEDQERDGGQSPSQTSQKSPTRASLTMGSERQSFLVDIVNSTQSVAANVNTMVVSMNTNINATFQKRTSGTFTQSPSPSMDSELKDTRGTPTKATRNFGGNLPQDIIFHKDTDFFEKDGHDKVVEVFENERFDPVKNTWGMENLLANDPKRFEVFPTMSFDCRDCLFHPQISVRQWSI
jgi:hypothetical protein